VRQNNFLQGKEQVQKQRQGQEQKQRFSVQVQVQVQEEFLLAVQVPLLLPFSQLSRQVAQQEPQSKLHSTQA
jgi:hypothetical protein